MTQRLFLLPAGEERCSPWHPCTQKVKCLRYRAAPRNGVPLADYSTENAGQECGKFLELPDKSKAP